MVTFVKQIKTGSLLLLLITAITGFIYPMLITGIAQLFFPWQANGSLLIENNKVIGSYLIGQYVEKERYFWPRPSATTPYPYNAASSSGSNLGPSNPDFLNTVQKRIGALYAISEKPSVAIPVDLVTASGSGLDPDISPGAAFYQIHRIAKARSLSEQVLVDLVLQLTKTRTFYLLGEPRINVIELNRKLDMPSTNGMH